MFCDLSFSFVPQQHFPGHPLPEHLKLQKTMPDSRENLHEIRKQDSAENINKTGVLGPIQGTKDKGLEDTGAVPGTEDPIYDVFCTD